MKNILVILSTLVSATIATSSLQLFPRQQNTGSCPDFSLEKPCGDYCIHVTWTCCADGSGGCPPSNYCSIGSNGKYGCCPDGEICEGPGGASIETITSKQTIHNQPPPPATSSAAPTPSVSTSIQEPPTPTPTNEPNESSSHSSATGAPPASSPSSPPSPSPSGSSAVPMPSSSPSGSSVPIINGAAARNAFGIDQVLNIGSLAVAALLLRL